MKQKLFLMSILICFILNAAPVFSTEFSAGIMSWYAWWIPPYKKEMTGGTELGSAGESYRMNSSNILYGPIVSWKFSESWNLSALFVFNPHGGFESYGRSLMASTRSALINGYYNWRFGTTYSPIMLGYAKIHADSIKRYDLDLMIDRWINKSFKIFFGLKYQGYRMDGRIKILCLNPQPLPGFNLSLTTTDDLFGGGLGIGSTLHVVDNVFLLGNISGFLLEGAAVQGVQTSRDNKTGMSTYGVNGNLSLAYYLEGAGTTLTLGYRAQVNWYGKPDLSHQKIANTGVFHGLMLSVLYRI